MSVRILYTVACFVTGMIFNPLVSLVRMRWSENCLTLVSADIGGRGDTRPMSTERHPATDRHHVSLKRLLIATSALPIAVLALVTVIPLEASAAPIEYQFTPDATISFSAGTYTEAISGEFTADVTGLSISDVAVTLTGPGAQSGFYDAATFDNSQGITFFEPFAALTLSFVTALGSTSSDISGASSHHTGGPTFNSTGQTGGVQAIPEPSSIALLGAALGLLFRRRRATRRDRSRPADQPRQS
jgi:hypothetical protein